MTTSDNKTPQLSSTSIESEPPEHPENSGMTKQPLKKQHPMVTWMVITVTCISLGCALYAIQINRQLQHLSMQNEDHLVDQMNALKEQQNRALTELTTTTQTLSDVQNSLQHQLHIINQGLHSVSQQHLYQSNDWLLLKARYYLELAQINTYWSHDLSATRALLQQADTILSRLHEPSLFAIRQAIAKEIAELEAIPKLDVVGVLSQLDATLNIVTSLQIKPPLSKQNHPINEKETAPSTWQQTITRLQSLVVIRRNNEDNISLPSPVYEAMLREGIRFNIQEAQWAVLQKNDKIYQWSLKQAIQNIQRVFANDHSELPTVIRSLQTLQNITLTQKKPILEQSLLLLNQQIESKDPKTNNQPSLSTGVKPS